MRSRSKIVVLLGLALVAALTLVVTACGGDDAAEGEGVITVNWAAEPPSLDPGLASDTTSSNILLNIMDPLVKLDEDLQPVPSLAESWETSEDGTTITFTLREDGQWTNGDPVTAGDFEYAWKRTVSPELAADYAYQFSGIVGADDYNSCEENCDAARDAMGVRALDDRTLEVQLTSEQPWFIQQVAHHSFLAVHQATVEQFGDQWTEAENIVTNGPFMLETWEHNSRIDIVKWQDWRDADSVSLERVNGRMITEGTTGVQAFEAGEVDVTEGLPPEETPRLKDLPEYQLYPSLGVYYYGINIDNVTDVNQRRAMALAIDRRAIIDNIAQEDQLPANGYTPEGMPGFETLNPASEWLPENGDIERAKELMSQVSNPVTDVTLVINDAPGHREIAVAVQANWRELGITTEIQQQEWAQFLEFIGPPPNASTDAFRLGWIADYVDAMNFLDQWTCDSGNNSTNFCNQEYDSLVAEARATPDNNARYDIYAQLEDMLFGSDGEMPMIPIYWYTSSRLEAESIKDTYNISPLEQIDLTKVVKE